MEPLPLMTDEDGRTGTDCTLRRSAAQEGEEGEETNEQRRGVSFRGAEMPATNRARLDESAIAIAIDITNGHSLSAMVSSYSRGTPELWLISTTAPIVSIISLKTL